jgi:hypothetical protein
MNSNQPSPVTRTITGDKEGIIALLTEQMDYARMCAEREHSTQKRREFHRGTAEGFDLAIRILRDWTQQ